jgi:hypothetical protein
VLALLVVFLGVLLLCYVIAEPTWRGRVTRAFRPAMLLGAIGFCGGFFGPLIFTPESNQGPLLGIFITGPLGAVVGLVWGIGRELWRSTSGAGQRPRVGR